MPLLTPIKIKTVLQDHMVKIKVKFTPTKGHKGP
jgi:hypothetical protein